MNRRWKMVGGGALALLLGTLLVPEPTPALTPPPNAPFVWGQDDVWAQLEARFDAAREQGCDASQPAIDAGLSGLDETLAQLESARVEPGAPILDTLEGQLFEVAPLFGACPAQVPALLTRASRLRAAVEDQSVRWDVAEDREARDALYRLLYGARAAVEELLLQMPEDEAPAVVRGVDEPSATPSYTYRGVTLHSGDVLLSRGGAPTSALIARGNDYPGVFSHVALLHVSEDGTPTVIESHIESGVGAFTAERYLADTKLRILVLRLRADHPALDDDPRLPHRAATAQLEAARAGHIPYDFAMDYEDPSKMFCSEVASHAYSEQGVHLWRGLSTLGGEGLTRWLGAVGVRYFETYAPGDLEYDPQMRVVAEYRDPETLFQDHVDNAILDVLLEGAEDGDELDYDYARLPLARLAKAYSWGLNLFGSLGPIPEGMSATTGLRVAYLRARHGAVRERLEPRVDAYMEEHGRRPPYWTLVRLTREAERETER
ncbi:MAG: hypothetical protein EVA89_20360 [Sandaracinaceae bacterium]|nr:MAG: hypothetical protein EVA89_20360 [Sandaracinaceae bacterium]